MQDDSQSESDEEDLALESGDLHDNALDHVMFEKLCGQLDECYYIRDTLRISLETLCVCAGFASAGHPPPAWQAWSIRVTGEETIGDILGRARQRYSRLFAAAAARGWVVEGLRLCDSPHRHVLETDSGIRAVACREPRHARHYRRVKFALSHAGLFRAFMLAQHARCGVGSPAHVLDDDVLRVLERVFRASYA